MALRIGSASLLLLHLATPCVLLGLSPDKIPTQRIRTAWTQEQGLPQDTIRALSQTNDGYLWVGTTEGLARFDGYEFTTFNKDDGSLPAALETWARRLVAGSSIHVQAEVSNVDRSLPEDLEQNVLRIVQEGVANAMKHARARMILIGLEIECRFLRVRIRDDGQGFEPQDTFSANGGHFGIVGMRERAERSGGKFCLESHPGSGTQVEVIVPIAR